MDYMLFEKRHVKDEIQNVYISKKTPCITEKSHESHEIKTLRLKSSIYLMSSSFSGKLQ